MKAAPLDISQVQKPSPEQMTLSWETNGLSAFSGTGDVDAKWSVVNQYVQEALLSRSSEPVFVSKVIAPKQLASRCAMNSKSFE